FYSIADVANWILLTLPRLFSDNGWTSFRLPAYHGPAAWIYAIYFVPLIVIAILANKWDPFAARPVTPATPFTPVTVVTVTTAILLLAIIVGHPFSAPSPDGRLHIDHLDVGQGDSALVTFPNGETLLVDGGGRPTYF